jgi:aspartyl-tRNA(Asn)/glutamyl-tRNA(Gln) amidotransferase subunit A
MAMADPPTTASLVALVRALRRRTLSPVDLVDAYLARVAETRKLGAFITEPGSPARREARRARDQLARGNPGVLLGVPIAVKDLYSTRRVRTTAGSRILREWVPAVDAAVVTRLRAAGAIIFGKTNLHEFAYGVTNANPWWGVAKNPMDPRRSPGGSSGGSAIAVVAGLGAAALGSDTGGSIRIPASLCGCVGLKPTYGSIPIDGAFPLGWSLDHAGPLTRTVDDAGLLFSVLSGRTPGVRVGARGLRVGVLAGTVTDRVQPGVMERVELAAEGLRRAGLSVRAVRIPELAWSVATQLVTLRAEASTVHARWIRRRPRAYGADVRARLQLGALVSGVDYVVAQRARARIRDAIQRVFQEVDVMILPTTPITAPLIGERVVRWPTGDEPVDGALVRLTSPFNLSGVPALSVPYGQAGGLPVGVQVVGPWNGEARALAVGRLIEGLPR